MATSPLVPMLAGRPFNETSEHDRGGWMAGREWKTEGEIRAMLYEEHNKSRALLYEEQNKWREEMRAHLDKQDKLGDKLIDGAQASLYTATVLMGDPSLGIQGALPELREQMASLETRVIRLDERADRTEDIVERHHKDNTDEIKEMKRNQHRMLKFVTDVSASFFIEEGKVNWKKVGGAVVGIGGALHVTFWPSQTAAGIRKIAFAVMHAMGN